MFPERLNTVDFIWKCTKQQHNENLSTFCHQVHHSTTIVLTNLVWNFTSQYFVPIPSVFNERACIKILFSYELRDSCSDCTNVSFYQEKFTQDRFRVSLSTPIKFSTEKSMIDYSLNAVTKFPIYVQDKQQFTWQLYTSLGNIIQTAYFLWKKYYHSHT